MKILHTSDWHLGQSLYNRKRYDEFSKFLNWLIDTIIAENVDILLVSGDIFDTTTPSNKAQELYYNFLDLISKSTCRHVVITGGNHDSPSLLNAPQQLLKNLNIHVAGAITDNIADEVIELKNSQNKTELIVCAVPYLRDKDIRSVDGGESIDDKNRKIIEGIKQHYLKVTALAEQKKQELSPEKIPVIVMGHLFTAEGKKTGDDGIRELYVGSLAYINAEIFSATADYVALGHLHVPQIIGGKEYIRYSGAPLPMGFGEARQEKSVVIIEFCPARKISLIKVPTFQKLLKISGGLPEIKEKISQLTAQNSDCWLEIEYNGPELVPNLKEVIDAMLTGGKLEVLRLQNRRLVEQIFLPHSDDERLEDLSPTDVFKRCLAVNNVSVEEQPILESLFNSVVTDLNENDSRRE